MTIARWLILAALFALLARIARLDAKDDPWERDIAWAVLVVAIVRGLYVYATDRRCPSCRGGPVGRVAAAPFRDQYFLCTACGQRMKRMALGRRWDASGPEDARWFEPKVKPVATWDGEAIRPQDDRPETATVGRLLREKLARADDAAPPVDLDSLPESVGRVPRANPRGGSGVQHPAARAFFRTLEALRWSRSSPP